MKKKFRLTGREGIEPDAEKRIPEFVSQVRALVLAIEPKMTNARGALWRGSTIKRGFYVAEYQRRGWWREFLGRTHIEEDERRIAEALTMAGEYAEESGIGDRSELVPAAARLREWLETSHIRRPGNS